MNLRGIESLTKLFVVKEDSNVPNASASLDFNAMNVP